MRVNKAKKIFLESVYVITLKRSEKILIASWKIKF